ncbi:hypothetical protein [Paenibacillus sp. YYML68]|uniref:hypothetical protein n=1 Tax=Paenibacillus sp. YYML68 TaxID=2909250 RepID=UPI0024902D28|nr:hypothetical protein [Paenibacillus sp. YYML68]
MNRTDSYHKMLAAAAKMQHNIALLLEAKAVEAQRSCQWICAHMGGAQYEDHTEQLKSSLDVHDQLLEVIDGMTKMERALAKHMTILLGEQEDGDGGEQGGELGDLFSFGGGSSK